MPLLPSISQRTVPWTGPFVACIQAFKDCFVPADWLMANSSTQVSATSRSNCASSEEIGSWIKSAMNGDGPAFQQIVIHYQTLISGRMWKFTRDRTAHEELVQDVFVEAFFSLASYRGTAPFEHWLQTIATRIGYRYWKSRRSKEHLTDDQLRSLASRETTNGTTSEEAAELVHYLLAQLPEADRLVLTLMSLEGCSVTETSRLTGWNTALVKVRAYRARRKLESLWKRIESRDVGGTT